MRSAIKAGWWVALIAAVIMLFWWAEPRLIRAYAGHLLASQGWTLVTLDAPRQFRFPLHVDRVAVRDATTTVSASGIVIAPVSLDTFVLSVDNVKAASHGESAPSSWRQLLAIASTAMPAMLAAGDIRDIEYCASRCIHSSLHWLRSGKRLAMTAQLPDFPNTDGSTVTANLWPEEAEVTLLGAGSTRYLIQSSLDWRDDAVKFVAHAYLDAGQTALSAHIDAPANLDIKLKHLTAHAEGKLPIDLVADAASFKQASVSFRAKADTDWHLKQRAAVITGGPSLSVHGQYGPDRSSVTLDGAMSSRVAGIMDSPFSASLGAGSSCKLEKNRLTCTLQDGGVLGISNISGTIETDLAASTGKVHINWQGPATDLKRIAGTAGLAGFNILSGRGEAIVDATFNTTADNPRAALQMLSAAFSLRHSSIAWSGFALAGIDANANMVGWPEIRSTTPITLTAREINIGVPITDISATFNAAASVEPAVASITGKTLVANILGGGVSSRNFGFDSRTGKGHVNLDIHGIDLGALLALEQEQLEGTGKIGGSVPIQIADGKLSIDKGIIRAAPPGGTIRYKPNATVQSMLAKNAQLKMVTDVMTDFRYDDLASTIDYTPAGLLKARTTLNGSNPGYQNGREIHFSLNLEENVGTLLKSLRLDNDVTKTIEDKVKQAAGASQGN